MLRAYRDNRFVQPAGVATLDFADFELAWLRAASEAGNCKERLLISGIGLEFLYKIFPRQR